MFLTIYVMSGNIFPCNFDILKYYQQTLGRKGMYYQ